ncbi:MAG: tripartite tricarboxylate transporter TctB family protein [Rhodospirillaceae bacterium]|jgi:putative tricarboxylic transport membrane protein
MSLNRDVFVGIFLLVICGAFFYASFDIQKPLFGQMSSALWPRIVLTPLTILSLIFLIKSAMTTEPVREARGGPKGWLGYYKNPIIIFLLFAIFLATMPYLGMLIGGILFVFILLSYLGGWTPRDLAIHGAIAVGTVGFMWSVFSFALGVILPQGELLSIL